MRSGKLGSPGGVPLARADAGDRPPGKKGLLAPTPTLCDILGDVRNHYSRQSCHVTSLPERPPPVNLHPQLVCCPRNSAEWGRNPEAMGSKALGEMDSRFRGNDRSGPGTSEEAVGGVGDDRNVGAGLPGTAGWVCADLRNRAGSRERLCHCCGGRNLETTDCAASTGISDISMKWVEYLLRDPRHRKPEGGKCGCDVLVRHRSEVSILDS